MVDVYKRQGDARDERSVAQVLRTSERSSVLGYDIVVAAPRPTSILLALDAEHGAGVVAAHRASVAAAIDYLEEHALVVRDRRGGGDRDHAGRWAAAVGFTHGVNRHGEPHLHDHVLVGALPEGSRSVLDSRGLFAHLVAADALYRTSLRHELSERTPWSAWRSFEGVEHVVGLDEGYRALWGGHHAERGEKLHWRRRDAVEQWSKDRGRFESLGAIEPPSRHRSTLDEHGFAAALEGRGDVARRHPVSYTHLRSMMVPGSHASKLGHPHPESNFCALVKRCWPHPPQVKTPSVSTCKSEPVHGISVDAWRKTA